MRIFVWSHFTLAQELHSPHLGPCLWNSGGVLCLDVYLAYWDLALLTWLPGLILDPFCQYRFAWTSLGSQLTKVTVIALFCLPCVRAVRWGPTQWIPCPVGLAVLPGSWCLCFGREAPLLQLLDSSVFWTKNHFYSALHCEQNNSSGIKSLWWPISSCRPDLNGFPTFRTGDLMEVTVHNLDNLCSMEMTCRELAIELCEAFAMKPDSTKLTSLGISLWSKKDRPVLPRVFLVFAVITGQPCHLVFCLASQAVFAISHGFCAMSDITCFYYFLVCTAEQISSKFLGERKWV